MDTMNPLPVEAGTMIPSDVMGELGRAVQEAIDAQIAAITTPMYPRWYNEKDYPEPDTGKALTVVQALENEFAPLRNQIRDDYASWMNKVSGVPKDFNRDDEEAWVDYGLMGEVEMIAYQLADSELAFDAPATTISDEDDAELKIDFALACLDDAARQHNTAGHGSLQLDKSRTLLTTGRLAWHCTLNLDADEGEMPFNETLLDPATCFPVFENKRGLKTMARVYTATVADVVGAFSTADNDLTSLYENRDKDGKFKTSYKDTDTVTVREYWDRRWRIVWMNGKVISGPVSHDYGFVPFVYKLGGLGLPGFSSSPESMTQTQLESIALGGTWNPRDVSNPNKGISLVRLLRAPHHMREAVMTKILSGFDKSINPPWLVEMDDYAYTQGTPEIDQSKNAVNPLKMGHQRIQPLPSDPSQSLMGAVLNGVQENVDRLKLPASAHGLNDKSNVAGYATNVLNQAGLVKLVPHKRVLEDFERECMEMRFKMYRDWGHLVQQGAYGTQGEITVPHADADPGSPRAFLITPTVLRSSGVKINVHMRAMSAQMLGAMGNSVNILLQAGLIDKVRALKILEDPNPHRTIRRIQADALLNDPVVQEMRVIETLRQQGLGEWADYYMQRKQAEEAGAQQAAAAPTDQGGGSPVQSVVGESNAQYGFGPGAGSGPQGPVGPRNTGSMPGVM